MTIKRVVARLGEQAAAPRLSPKDKKILTFLNSRFSTKVTPADMVSHDNGFNWWVKSPGSIGVAHWDRQSKKYNDTILENLNAGFTAQELQQFFEGLEVGQLLRKYRK